MGKIVLTSVGSKVLERVVKYLNLEPSKLRVLFIPTAANLHENKDFIIEDKKKLIELGFEVIECDISVLKQKELGIISKNVEIIYIAGGNTFYLLQEVRKSGFDKILKKLIKSDRIYIGSSAGSAILGPTIEYVKYFDNSKNAPGLRSFDGLNILDFLLLPHFNDIRVSSKFDSLKKEFNNFNFSTISDEEFILVDYKKPKSIKYLSA